MARPVRIVLVAPHAPERERLVNDLSTASLHVAAIERASDAAQTEPPDLVLIDAGPQGAVTAVRACRKRWPDRTTPVLVLNAVDAATSAAAIDAGATDSVVESIEAPVLHAHVHRMLRAGEALRITLDEARERIGRESLARAAAEVAAPLGELVDGLESMMHDKSGKHLSNKDLMSDLLDRIGRAMDAVERLRHQGKP